MTIGSLTRPQVLHVAHQFLTLAEEQNAEVLTEQVRSQLEIYNEREFQLLVVGEVKKGKSFFINALLGEPNLLPIDTHVATATVYKVMYGDTKKYKIFFNPTVNPEGVSQYEEARSPIETTDPKKVAEYGTENQNPGNKKEVARIEVYLPNPILKSGAVIIDTPGLNSLFAEHGEIPWCYAPTANAICFVLDSLEAPATAEDMANLKGFLKIAKQTSGSTPFLFFVQTKTDLVDQEGWQTYRDRNTEIIKKNLPEYFTDPEVELNYFPVSSELEELANADDTMSEPDSGFSLVHECLEGMLQKHEERSARELLEPIKSITERNLLPHVVNKQTILREAYTAKGTEYQSEFVEIQARLDKWQGKIFPQLQRDFRHKAENLKMDTNDRLERELNPSAAADLIIEPLIADLKASSRQISAKDVEAVSNAIQADCVEVCNEKMFNILKTYQDRMNALIQGNGEKLLDSLVYKGTSLSIREISSNRELDMSVPDSAYRVTKVGLIITSITSFTTVASAAGASAACTCASAACTCASAVGASAVLGVALPILGTILVAGALYFMYRHAKESHVLQTIQNLEALLTKVVGSAHMEATLQFKRIAHAYEKAIEDFFEKAVSEIVAEANRNMSVIKNASNLNAKTYGQKTDALKAQEGKIKGMLDTLKEMLGSNAQTALAIH